MTEKPRFPLALAQRVGAELTALLEPHCEKIQIAGSVRRLKPEVGDLEIVFVPKFREEPGLGMFKEPEVVNAAAGRIWELVVEEKILGQRLNSKGRASWGDKNMLAYHVATGLPVDLFQTTEDRWFNYLVCRTGPSGLNVAIATRAKLMGLTWEVYGRGFKNLATGERTLVTSEAQVFEMVDLPYQPPERRG